MSATTLTTNPYPTGIPDTAQMVGKLRGAKVLFSGHIEVARVANGYLVSFRNNIHSDSEVYIAHTVAEVNELITTHMVAFRLEDKQ